MDITTTNKDIYGIDYASSHLIKNSEWGAVAYLCYSQYGEVPQINGAGSYGSKDGSGWYYDLYTGAGPQANGNTGRYEDFDSESDTETRAYNKEFGVLASTTGNVTGVYDMNGGAWERVAGYLDNGDSNLSTYAGSYFEEKGTNEGGQKYYGIKAEYASLWDSYEVSAEEKNDVIDLGNGETITKASLWDWNKKEEKYQQARYNITRATFQNMAKYKGIGVNEMATENSFYAPYSDTKDRWGWFKTVANATAGITSGGGATSWDGDGVYIGHARIPFVLRGGDCNFGSTAGVLCTYITDGYAYYYYGFRPVVVL